MHRSASWNRFSDDYFKHSAITLSPGHRSYSVFDTTTLPTYDPIAELAKKEKARVKFAENAVHVIPFVLLVCALALWLFSNPDVGMIGDPIGRSIEGMSLEGEIENDSDGTQTGFLPIVNPDDISTKDFAADKLSIHLKNFK
ncbi:hypothetical protein HN51_055754 [Arachis hypogaea]|uniref:Transmembrane protein n=1 Tax=Arachis hypogaea TaxID=3818 RepID=A0A444XR56_ARAHY|nr:uncharacterized protein LOC107616057 [Arachis ipaensis]QHN78530.1 uncharacterized protein DS421_19g662090 [Arachis hypogaea]RYQ92229.1 hypothetical protein Ahy_B09g098412 [Arachis hypogaea]